MRQRAIGGPGFGPLLSSSPGYCGVQHVAVSILVEHRRGRRLADLFRDDGIRASCSLEQLQLLLEQPSFIRALRNDLRPELP